MTDRPRTPEAVPLSVTRQIANYERSSEDNSQTESIFYRFMKSAFKL